MQAARIEFDYPVELGLASVASQLVLGLKERPPLLRAVADTGASGETRQER